MKEYFKEKDLTYLNKLPIKERKKKRALLNKFKMVIMLIAIFLFMREIKR